MMSKTTSGKARTILINEASTLKCLNDTTRAEIQSAETTLSMSKDRSSTLTTLSNDNNISLENLQPTASVSSFIEVHRTTLSTSIINSTAFVIKSRTTNSLSTPTDSFITGNTTSMSSSTTEGYITIIPIKSESDSTRNILSTEKLNDSETPTSTISKILGETKKSSETLLHEIPKSTASVISSFNGTSGKPETTSSGINIANTILYQQEIHCQIFLHSLGKRLQP